MEEKMSRRDFLKVMGAPMILAPIVMESLDIRSPVQELGAQKAVLVDTRRCIGCRACQVACKAWNKLPAEKTTVSGPEYTSPSNFSPITWKIVHFKEIGDYDDSRTGTGGLKWRMLADNCKHCLDPSCVAVCPTGALWKRSDGPVLYDINRCIGCGYCETACPWGIPKFDDTLKSIRKCTMCFDRIDQGLEPACVQTCPTDALQFMSLEKAQSMVREAAIRGLNVYGLSETGGTSWMYISDVPFSEFGFSEYSEATQKSFQTEMLARFAGASLFVAGALVLVSRVFDVRKERIEEMKKEEDE